MKYRHIHILAALFLIVGMAMQFVMAYRQVMRHQQENARLESDRKVMSHESQIANGIQMGILRHDFPQDETLELYTDGVTEARGRTQQMMGMERWMDMAAHDADLLEAVKRYIGTAEPTDDITLMTISRKSGVRAQTND